ncbi:30S ribosomal protein S20 [bacterium]|nr:30S ribosomal protein S20 [bacterium]
MPRTKSALKALKRSEKRRLRNKAIKSALRTFLKKAITALMEKDVEKAKEAVRIACSRLDKAASKGVIHKNEAARRKSKLMEKLHKLLSSA